jgi:para-aminobenzoate synthetase component 1
MLSALEVKDKMNYYGKELIPFLFIIDFEKENGYFVDSPLKRNDILFSINSITNAHNPIENSSNSYIKSFPISFEDYEKKFDIIHNGLKHGDSFLANLTLKTKIETNLGLEEIFYRANSKYKILVKDKFVCFSPESFIQIKDDKISTYPMKGTIDSSIDNADDVILNDYKETCEHNTIVDLMRNDLNMISSNVRVERFRYIDKLKTSRGGILQVSSEIIGDLDYDYHSILGDIFFKLLPAGSISGAPKEATLNLIKNSESEKRGFYTGIFGYFDGKNLDSAVIIRYIEKENQAYYFRSGGGITINSKAMDEYHEAINKIYLPF